MTNFVLRIGNQSFVARLLEAEASKTCVAFLAHLLIEGKVIHVRWSG